MNRVKRSSVQTFVIVLAGTVVAVVLLGSLVQSGYWWVLPILLAGAVGGVVAWRRTRGRR